MKYVVPIVVIVGVVVGVLAFTFHPSSGEAPSPTPQISAIPEASASEASTGVTPMQFTNAEQVIKAGKTYTATLKTDDGDIVIALDAKDTPKTVNNFVFLAEKHFYDNTIFHRVIKGFMIQGGDPTGTGTGGPGYRFADEPFTGTYTRGTVAMANAGPNTNGSQFFIMHADVNLPHSYVIFGHVTSGMDTVDKIADAPMKQGGEGSSPVVPVHILSATIVEK